MVYVKIVRKKDRKEGKRERVKKDGGMEVGTKEQTFPWCCQILEHFLQRLIIINSFSLLSEMYANPFKKLNKLFASSLTQECFS